MQFWTSLTPQMDHGAYSGPGLCLQILGASCLCGPQIMPVFIGLLLAPSDNARLHPSFSCLVQKGGTEQQEEAKNSNLSDELLPENPFTLPLLASQRGPRQDSSGLREASVQPSQFTSIPRSNKVQLS